VRQKIWTGLTVAVLVSLALAAPKGTVPRSSASRYPVHAQNDGTSVGARMLSAEEARKTFVSEINHCCAVVEFAIYPERDKPTSISLDSFSLRRMGNETATKPSSAKVVSATLQKSAREQRDISVSPTVGVGYESGNVYDPVTGAQRRGGVYTSTGVGVGIGSKGNDPGSSEKDRVVMETELSEKGLPEGATATPVAGYLYFPISGAKKGTYQLEYMLNGTNVKLNFQ
jgi:hypothetical protein